jgi:GNAT superfamily N-acetyltransferase
MAQMSMNVIAFDEKYLNQLVEFINIVWDKNAIVKTFTEKRERDLKENPYGLEGGFPIYMLMENGRVVGNIDATPCRLWANGKENSMYWISGLHILPECRGKGVAKFLPMKVMEQLPIVTGCFVLQAPYKIYKKLGWNILGKIPEYIKINNPRAFFHNVRFTNLDLIPRGVAPAFKKMNTLVSSIGSLIVTLYNKTFDVFSLSTSRNNCCRNVDHFDKRVDDLWERNKTAIKLAQIRNSEYMNWMFKAEKGWTKIIFEEEDRTHGYAILSCKQFNEDRRLGNLKILSIIDILWDFEKSHVLRCILDYVERIGISENVDVIVCSINHHIARRMLLRKGYIRIPSKVYFEYYVRDHSVILSNNMDDWYITRGDADAAGSLAADA